MEELIAIAIPQVVLISAGQLVKSVTVADSEKLQVVAVPIASLF
jgi:hypothetical protein